MFYYVFAAPERGISPNDILISIRTTKAKAIAFAKSCESVETYVMNACDVLVWQSWPDIDAALKISHQQ